MRTVAVVTGSRADYGIYRSLLRRIREHPELRLRLLVTGMHLAPEFGRTVDRIVADGFVPDATVDLELSGDAPADIARAMGRALIGFADVFQNARPDLLVALGDRFEMHAAVMAAVPFGIPVAHIAGGAVSAGAIDEVFRHGITKAAHIHFAETEVYARRLVRMGEQPASVHVTGALALDELLSMPLPARAELERKYGGPWEQDPLLVTFHSVTTEYDQAGAQAAELLAALAACGRPLVITCPNADPGGRVIKQRLREFTAGRTDACLVENLGFPDYPGMLAVAGAMVGNSSSGLVEAPSFRLPVVNVGNRQLGRMAPDNVIAAPCRREAIAAALRRALSDEFRAGLAGLVNPYGAGRAGARMVEVLARQELGRELLQKKFYDGD